MKEFKKYRQRIFNIKDKNMKDVKTHFNYLIESIDECAEKLKMPSFMTQHLNHQSYHNK